MGLNHIYKVIWSKTKNAWVVVSEIAKRDGKSSVKSVVTSLAGKSAAAVMVAMVMCGGVVSADTQYGTGATASHGGATAIGDNADANKTGATAIGSGAKSLELEAIAIGAGATANSQYAISIGAVATGINSIAIGNGSATHDDKSIAMGRGATVMKNGGIAIGDSSLAQDFGSVVIGAAYAKGIAIGSGSYDTGGGVALGHSASSHDGIGIGWGATANSGISLGNYATGSDRSVSIGVGSNAYDYSIAIGDSATVNGSYSISMGRRNIVKSDKSGAIGDQSHMDNDAIETYVLGNTNGDASNLIKAKNSGIFGNSNKTGQSTITGIRVIGNNNTVKSSNVMVMGNNVTVDTGYDGAVVLGHQSATQAYTNPTDTTISGLTLDASKFYGTTTNGSTLTNGSIVSIGDVNKERQIKNVAAGLISSTSTDAVNGSQLYEAVRTVTASTSPDVYVHINDGTATQGAGNATTNLGKVNEKGGATGQYSIAIGYQAKASGSNSLSIGSQNIVDGDNSTVVGSQSYFSNTARQSYGFGLGNGVSGSPIVASDSYFIGAENKANKVGTSNIYVLGSGNEIKSTNVYAVGESNVITDSDVTNIYGFDNHITKSPNSIVIGQGVQIDDAVKSLFIGTGRIYGKMSATADDNQELVAIGHNNNFENGSQKSSITIGNNNRSIGAKQNIIIGTSNIVSSGANLDDGTRFYSEKSGIFGNGYGLIGKGTYYIGNSTENGSTTFPASSRGLSKNSGIFGNDSAFGGHLGTIPGSLDANKIVEDSRIIGNNSMVAASDVMAIGNYIFVHDWNMKGAVILGSGSGASQYVKPTDSIINGDTFTSADYAGQGTTTNPLENGYIVSVGNVGYERQIKNVAAGEVTATSTDAINGSQLYSVADQLAKGGFGYMHVNDGTTTQKAGTTATNYGAGGSKAGATGTKSIAGGMNAQAAGEQALAMGTSAEASGKNSIAQGSSAIASAEDAIAIGNGAKVSGEKSISIGTGNEVKGNKSSAVGDPSYIDTTATGTHVQGNDNGTATNPIKASESTFMGNTNLAGTAGTTGIHVVGNNNSVDSSNVMVMGNNVTVGTGLDGAVVLGHASSADQYAAATDSTINGVTFEAAGYAGNTGLNKGSIVSVGATGAERQIKNVAAGAVTATSTDAINGSQLYKTAETILKMPINMAGDSGDTVGLKLGKTVNIKGSVASGADVTDGNIAVVGDKATSTLSLKMAKKPYRLNKWYFHRCYW